MILLRLSLKTAGQILPYVSLERQWTRAMDNLTFWHELDTFTRVSFDSADDAIDQIVHKVHLPENKGDVEIVIDGSLEGLAHALAHRLLFTGPTNAGLSVDFDDEGAPVIAARSGNFQTKGGTHYLVIHVQ